MRRGINHDIRLEINCQQKTVTKSVLTSSLENWTSRYFSFSTVSKERKNIFKRWLNVAHLCLTLAGGPNTLNIRSRVDMRKKKTLEFSWYNPTYTHPVCLPNRAGSSDRERHETMMGKRVHSHLRTAIQFRTT